MSIWFSGTAVDSIPGLFHDSVSPAAWQLMDGGVATFHAPELIRPGRERFCRLLAAKATELQGVRRVQLCTATSLWRVEFSPEMLGVNDVSAHLVRSVREALSAVRAGKAGGGFATTWVAFPNTGASASVWEIVKKAPGRFRFRSRRLRCKPVLARRVAGALEQVFGVQNCRARGLTGTLDVKIDEEMISSLDLVTTAEELSRRIGRPDNESKRKRTRTRWLIRSRGSEQWRDLVLAGGSFVMVVVGVILPGIPSAPFLLLTAYFSVRCWPGLRGMFVKFPRLVAALEGPLPRPAPEEIVKSVSSAALASGLFLVIHPPLPLVLGFELGLAAVYASHWMRQAGDQENELNLALPHP